MISKAIILGSVFLPIALGTANAQSLNIDFGAGAGTPDSTYQGAAGQAGTWTTVTDVDTSTVYNLDGSVSGATITTTLTGGWQIFTGVSGHGSELLDDNFYIDTNSTWTVTFSGLANGTYTVYYYAPNNSAVPTGDFTINGVARSSISGNATNGSTDLVQGTSFDYLVNVAVTDGTITLASAVTTSYAGLSGVQLVLAPVPEPSDFAFAGGLGALGMVMLRKRKRV